MAFPNAHPSVQSVIIVIVFCCIPFGLIELSVCVGGREDNNNNNILLFPRTIVPWSRQDMYSLTNCSTYSGHKQIDFQCSPTRVLHILQALVTVVAVAMITNQVRTNTWEEDEELCLHLLAFFRVQTQGSLGLISWNPVHPTVSDQSSIFQRVRLWEAIMFCCNNHYHLSLNENSYWDSVRSSTGQWPSCWWIDSICFDWRVRLFSMARLYDKMECAPEHKVQYGVLVNNTSSPIFLFSYNGICGDIPCDLLVVVFQRKNNGKTEEYDKARNVCSGTCEHL